MKMIQELLPRINGALGVEEDSFKAIKIYRPLSAIAPELDGIVQYTLSNTYIEFAMIKI